MNRTLEASPAVARPVRLVDGRRRICVLAVLALLSWSEPPAGAVSPRALGIPADRPARPYNVLVYTVDTTRADHLSLYGYPRKTTPFLESIARTGLRWTSFYTASTWTWPSVTSMLTSVPVPTHKVNDWHLTLSPGWTSLPELLRDQGYRTALFSSNIALPLAGRLGHLFDLSVETRRPDQRLTDRLIDYLKDPNARPFFVWAQPYGPHAPYVAPPPYDTLFVGDEFYGDLGDVPGLSASCSGGMPREDVIDGIQSMDWYVAQYDGLIAYIDDQIRQLVEFLTREGLMEDTLVIITSDHGENLAGEHGFYFCHRDVFEDNIRIPLVILLPEEFQSRFGPFRGLVLGGTPDHLDLMPTILDILGVEGPAEMKGVSLVQRSEPRWRAGSTHFEGSMHHDSLKIAHHGFEREPNGNRTLFDLAVDPLEQVNLALEPDYFDLAYRMEVEFLAREARAAAVLPPPWHGVLYDSDLDDPAESDGFFDFGGEGKSGWVFSRVEGGNRVLHGRLDPGKTGKVFFIGPADCGYGSQTRTKLLRGRVLFSLCWSGGQGYLVEIGEDSLALFRGTSDGITRLAGAAFPFGLHQWHVVGIESEGPTVRLSIDGIEVLRAEDPEPRPPYGTVFFGVVSDGAEAYVDEVRIERR